jgi:hypothetical protein
MLMIHRVLPALLVSALPIASATAQELAPHRAAYSVTTLDHGKPSGEPPGTYAYELKATCDGYTMIQRLRLDVPGERGSVANEQQSQMTESRDGRSLRFEHVTRTSGRQTTVMKGEARLGDSGAGEARFTEPAGQTVALPKGTLFPAAIARETIRQAKAGATSFDALFFFGDKVKPPQSVNVVIGRIPRRLADLKIPEGGDSLAAGRQRIYYRAAFFDTDAKGQGAPAFEMSSITLDNGVELFGTHEEGETGIEYRITRLEPLARPECH